jgi:hypothetical protein
MHGLALRRELARIEGNSSMRTVIVAIALAGAAGAARAEAARQNERPLVFQRVCNIEPGQESTAAALAGEMVDLVERKYPGAEMSARTGRWMTGFQNIQRPVNQILFIERHPDADMRLVFNEILMGDEEFRALQQRTAGVVDFSSCTETRFRARP